MIHRPRPLAIAAILLAGLSSPKPARAEMVAGWDFSQYFGDGLLSIDGQGYTGTLSANYSNLDPTYNAGAESALFGTMYVDGQYGSTAVSLGSGAEEFLPTAAVGGSLLSNLDAPVQGTGDVSFDAEQVLRSEGQAYFNYLAMIAAAPVSVVFAADRGAPASGHWILSLGARAWSGTSTMQVDFSENGSGYANVASIPLDAVDSAYEVDLGPASGPTAFVRLRFTPAGVDQPIVDNVAISVPEAGAAAQLIAAATGLALCARRRG
jgi:hypothetical protein